MATQEKTPAHEKPPFIVPDGVTFEYRSGPLSGKPMFKVSGFEMPYQGTEEEAVRVYLRLNQAYSSGYFAGNPAKH